MQFSGTVLGFYTISQELKNDVKGTRRVKLRRVLDKWTATPTTSATPAWRRGQIVAWLFFRTVLGKPLNEVHLNAGVAQHRQQH